MKSLFSMDKEKLLKFYLYSYFVTAMLQGFCGSVIQIFMIKHISDEFFKVYRSLDMLIPIVILLYFKKSVKIVKLRRYFTKIIGFSTIAFTIANIGGMFSPEFRFLIICIIEGFGSFLWIMIMDDLFNNTFNNTALTIWNNKNQLWHGGGVFVGTALAILIIADINTCLILQCIAYIYMGFVDYLTFEKLSKDYKVFEKEGGIVNG